MFTSADYEKFRELRVTHLATRFAELISDDEHECWRHLSIVWRES